MLDSIKTTADEILQSVDTPQQNDLQSEVTTLTESAKNCLTAANDRQDQLEKDSRAYKDYEKSLEEVKQAIVANKQSVEEMATNIPALKNLIASLETKLVVLQVISCMKKTNLNVKECEEHFNLLLFVDGTSEVENFTGQGKKSRAACGCRQSADDPGELCGGGQRLA